MTSAIEFIVGDFVRMMFASRFISCSDQTNFLIAHEIRYYRRKDGTGITLIDLRIIVKPLDHFKQEAELQVVHRLSQYSHKNGSCIRSAEELKRVGWILSCACLELPSSRLMEGVSSQISLPIGLL